MSRRSRRLTRPGQVLGVLAITALPVTAQEVIELPAEDRLLDAGFDELYRVGSLLGGDWDTFGRVVDVAFDGSGNLYVLDTQAARISVVGLQGDLVRRFGRVGEGPGEFMALFDAVFLSDDRIVALDGGRVLATLFDSSGEVLKTFPLREQLNPRAVVAIDDSTFLIGGLVGSPGGSDHLARLYSLDGSVSESFFPADRLLFDTQMVVDRVWGVALPGGTLALGLAITPAIHLFSETGAHICTQASEPPQWSQLLPRDEPGAMDQATREWIQRATLTAGAAYAGGSLYRQYGSSGEGGVSLLAEYDDALNLRDVYAGFPGRLVGGDGETLFFLGEETIDATRLLRFQRSGRE